MKLEDIYYFFVRGGIAQDFRSKTQIQKKLSSSRKEYRGLKKRDKKFFDKEKLTNPYSDTRILHGSGRTEVKRILVGIDIGVSELLLAEELARRGKKIDLILAHHPSGIALSGLHDVMDLQTDRLEDLGIRREIAEELMGQRIKEVARGVHGANHTRTVDAARLLGMPFMCCHTPSDNYVARYLQKSVDTRKPGTLQQLVNLLLEEPEYQDAMRNGAGPMVVIGKPQDKAGKVVVDMTGGTEGSKDIFARLSQLGIGTQLSMHLSEDHFRKLKSEHIHLVIAGHMASDNLGMNLLLDALGLKHNLEFVECSGFRRVKRKWG